MRQQIDELIPTRASLLNRLKDWQDQTSWREFFNTYWRLIYGVARKAGLTDAEAQDVVQETMVSVAKHMPAFKYDPAIGSFKAWLLIKTRWCIIGQLRKRGPLAEPAPTPRNSTLGTDPIDKVADSTGEVLDEVWEEEWKKNLMEAGMAKVRRQIDPQKYQIFDFCANKNWSPKKVAESFGVSVAQVYLVKHRVTEAIREEVKRLEKDLT